MIPRLLKSPPINSLILLNFICICVSPSTNIRKQLATSIASNSTMLLKHYIVTMVQQLTNVPTDEWAIRDKSILKNLCRCASLHRDDLADTDCIDQLAKLVSSLGDMQDCMGVLALTSEPDLETCAACDGDVQFTDASVGTCVNGHEWSKFSFF